jgi:hypothetical protein
MTDRPQYIYREGYENQTFFTVESPQSALAEASARR